MSIKMIFRIAFGIFFGVLIVMQIYFAYRIRQSRQRLESDVTTDDEPRLSPKASYRYALFLIAYHVFLMIWAGYGIWIGNVPWFLGLAAIVVAIGFVRKPLSLARRHHPVAVGFRRDLSIRSVSTDSVTPEHVRGILNEEGVVQAIKDDLLKTGEIGHKEAWRLGLITPERDRFDPRLYQLSRQERIRRALEDPSFRFTVLGKIPVERTAVLHSSTYFDLRFNNLVITAGHSLRSYGLSTRTKSGELTRIRDIQISQASAGDRSRLLPQFLREHGFPLKDWYADGDPLTTDRGGTIVNDHGKIIVIYPEYFVQRRLIDDEGNLVYIGLDESIDHRTAFEIEMQPSTSRLLVRCVSYHEYLPILRYRSFRHGSLLSRMHLDN